MAAVRSFAPGDELLALIASRVTGDGLFDAPLPGVRFIRCAEGTTFSEVLPTSPTLSVIAQGEKNVRVGTRDLRYERGHWCLVAAETLISGRAIGRGRDQPYLSVSIEIPPEVVTKTLLALGDEAAAPERAPEQSCIARLDHHVADAVARLVRAADDAVDRRVLAPLILEELVFRLLRSGGAALLRGAVVRGQDARAIEAAMRYIREHAARPLTVDEVARQVAMSPSHFAHRFRQVARVSPMRYVKQMRLEQARALLVTDGLRVSEAADRMGYESPSHFARDFKRSFGATPAAYLRRFRDG